MRASPMEQVQLGLCAHALFFLSSDASWSDGVCRDFDLAGSRCLLGASSGVSMMLT
eukprot:CAMPEP_0180082514 /NCGR_PEP_ID=MMETSP0985-20121206/18764_1 /TAXON_ID=483367 /ORGANISM="non described non described, Strain CCMP 2436" /LENGTH=55 /DNA_ID=CAMNT_0022015905 /DNA_START=45 /DNA_END=212 /DNA_ORIENTATION=-